MNVLTRAYRALTRRRQAERDMQDEFRFHLDMEAQDLVRGGIPDREARRRAAAAFGAADAHKDAARDGRRMAWADDVMRDARYAVRQLRHAPGFAAVVVVTLAVGMAATSTIFSIVNGVLLRPLPYAEPERLVAIAGLSYKGEFVQLRDEARTVTVGGYAFPRMVTLTGSGEPARLHAVPASADMFAVLGVPAEHGRTFTQAEGHPGATPAVVLSHAAWQRRFGGAPGVVGRQLTIDGVSRTVVGIMPAAFTFPDRAVEIWTPLVVREGDPIDLWAQSARMIGRLRGSATADEARAEILAHVPRFRAQFPWKMPADYGSEAGAIPLRDHVVGDVRRALIVLLAAVAAVLAIVCVNVANLMLARGLARQREMAIRAAIGAGKARLFRQMIAESLTLAGIAGGVGLLLTYWVLGAVISRLPADMPRVDEIGIDVRVIAFTCATALVTGVVLGIWPALRNSAARIDPALRDAGRSAGIAPGPRRTAQALVAAEIALAVVLVTSAVLLVQSFRNLIAVNPGFRTDGLVTATVAPPDFRYRQPASRRAFTGRLLDRLRQMEGVVAASASTALPLGPEVRGGAVFAIEGRPDPATQSGEWPLADVAATVDAAYFATMGMPIEAGRGFTAEDRVGTVPVALVSRSLASQYWPDGLPLGARIRLPGAREWLTIVGIVGDVKWNSLAEEHNRTLYRPLSQNAAGPLSIVVRTGSDPSIVAGAFRGIVATLDRDTPVSDIRTADALIAGSVEKPRFTASLLALFGLVALCLGAVGVYGVLAYTVSRRTQEIGVRMALGARAGDVLRLVLGQGAAVALVGVAVGLAAAFAVTRGLSSLLFGVSAADPLVFAGVAATLLAVALLASLLPALRAAHVNPVTALRGE
jgi:putative ABC transport system permease protein